MKDEIDKIERFLRGKMNNEEESNFKTKVKSDALIRLQANFITMFIRKFQ